MAYGLVLSCRSPGQVHKHNFIGDSRLEARRLNPGNLILQLDFYILCVTVVTEGWSIHLRYLIKLCIFRVTAASGSEGPIMTSSASGTLKAAPLFEYSPMPFKDFDALQIDN